MGGKEYTAATAATAVCDSPEQSENELTNEVQDCDKSEGVSFVNTPA